MVPRGSRTWPIGVASLGLLLAIGLLAQPGLPQTASSPAPCSDVPNKIKYAMYFMSKPQDAAECGMSVSDGRIVCASAITNPAMTCPDMFAWKLFADAVSQEFWKGWAADQYTWPANQVCPRDDPDCRPTNPLPLCGTPGADPAACCHPDRRDNPGYDDPRYPAKYCPYFPGDHPGRHASTAGMPLHVGLDPFKAHLPGFGREASVRARLAEPDPGRRIRQSMAELVFRNKAMFDYIFRHDLYNQEGLIAVFNRNRGNLDAREHGAPYRLKNTAGALAEIDLPVSAIMLKTNWLNRERAERIGIREDPGRPYIKMTLLSPVTDDNGTILEPGEHWLVAMHISSKDTPNWAWATFEHVDNPGRCDYAGCNDSHGYRTADSVGPNQATNFTTPRLRCDGLLLPSWVFDTGQAYPSGAISDSLRRVFDALAIGTRNAVPGADGILVPSRHDRGWLSYRLKGSQVQFTDSMGRPTRLGNSVTEGGFAQTSSCISCHARAGTTADGTIPPALGVFLNELSEVGYGQSNYGIPVPDWYHRSNQPPALMVLQTDFVWGFLFANRIQPVTPVPAPAPTPGPPAAPPKAPSSRQHR